MNNYFRVVVRSKRAKHIKIVFEPVVATNIVEAVWLCMGHFLPQVKDFYEPDSMNSRPLTEIEVINMIDEATE